MRANGNRVSIGLASLCLLGAMPVHAHVNGGMPYSWWYWLSRAHWHDHGGGHGNGNGHGNGHGGGHSGGHNGGHGGGHNGGHHGGHGHGHGGGHGGPGPGNGNGCPPTQSGGSSSSAATWAGGQCTASSSNWSDRSNWSAGAPPSGATSVATFGASRVTTINFETTSTLGTLQFNAGAPAYTFNIGTPYTLTLAGAGIGSLAAVSPTFNVSGRMNFTNGASAGNAALVAAAGGIIDFSGVTSGVPTAGSIAGAGTLNLGRNTLNVGSLNTSTTFSGSIVDGTLRGGSLRKSGTGTLSLTGVSNYTGSTTIAGLLEVVRGGRVEGTSSITVADLAAETGAIRVSGAQSKVSTPGGIIIGNAGNGTLTLDEGAAVNASSISLGVAAGSSGTLNIGSGGLAGVLSAANIVGGSGSAPTININHSQSAYTLASDLLGRLSVNHNGSGTTTLTGANAYSGGTYLNAGAIRIAMNTQLGGGGSGVYFNGGTLQTSATITGFTHPVVLAARGGSIDTGAFNVTATGAFSGTGRLTKTGTGTLTLSGASTYTGGTTVSAGTLRGTSGSLVGNIVNNGAVAFLQVSNGEYSGVMSGSGSLTKFNSGTLVMSGANTFMGGTIISIGTLAVTGSLASSVAVGESGTLSGTGTVNAPVTISGVLAPGVGGTGSIGTLTVRNSVRFDAGSVYRVDADSTGRADRLAASGAVTIGEAAVEVVANPAGTWAPNTSYTILTAGGGINGQFADVTTDLAFLTPSLSYQGNNVNLTLTRNDTTFSSVARSKKQSVTANYLQALDAQSGDDRQADTVISNVMQSSATQARNVFEQISGSDLSRASRVSAANTSKLVDVLATRLAGRNIAQPAADGSDAGQGVWMRSLAASAEEAVHGERGDSSTFDWRSSGVVTGFDAALSEETLLGLSVSYARSSAMLNGRRDSFADVRTPQLMLYAASEQGRLQMNAVAGYALSSYRTERRLSLLDGAAAVADHSARELSLYLEATPASGYGERRLLQPLLAVRYARSSEDRYTEAGSAGGLAVMGRTSQSLTSEAGARLVRELSGNDGLLELRAVWSRSYAGNSSSLTAHLASDTSGEAFTVADGTVARDRFVLDMKLTARLREKLSFRLDCSVNAPVGAPVQKLVSVGMERTW